MTSSRIPPGDVRSLRAAHGRRRRIRLAIGVALAGIGLVNAGHATALFVARTSEEYCTFYRDAPTGYDYAMIPPTGTPTLWPFGLRCTYTLAGGGEISVDEGWERSWRAYGGAAAIAVGVTIALRADRPAQPRRSASRAGGSTS